MATAGDQIAAQIGGLRAQPEASSDYAPRVRTAICLEGAAARQRLAAGQGELELEFGLAGGVCLGGPLEIASPRMGHRWDALCRAYDVLGFGQAAGGDEVFLQLVLVRSGART